MSADVPTTRARERPTGKASRWVALYLRNHEAAAQGGVSLFRRAAQGQADRPWGPALAALADEVSDDQRALLRLMRSWRVRPDPVAALAVTAGERLGRLKPNGRVVRRSPLSDLLEVEAATGAVQAKWAGWQAVRVASTPPTPVDLEALSRRAEDQLDRLRSLHAEVAAAVL